MLASTSPAYIKAMAEECVAQGVSEDLACDLYKAAHFLDSLENDGQFRTGAVQALKALDRAAVRDFGEKQATAASSSMLGRLFSFAKNNPVKALATGAAAAAGGVGAATRMNWDPVNFATGPFMPSYLLDKAAPKAQGAPWETPTPITFGGTAGGALGGNSRVADMRSQLSKADSRLNQLRQLAAGGGGDSRSQIAALQAQRLVRTEGVSRDRLADQLASTLAGMNNERERSLTDIARYAARAQAQSGSALNEATDLARVAGDPGIFNTLVGWLTNRDARLDRALSRASQGESTLEQLAKMRRQVEAPI